MDYKLYLSKISNNLANIGLDILIIIAVFVVAKIYVNIVGKITGKTMKNANKIHDEQVAKQLKTSMTITHSANRYIVYVIAIYICARIIGFGDEVSSAIVTAGIGGLIISFGAQSIVKDMISGLFLMFEKQFFVGDYVKINDFEGTVKSIALRVTYLECNGKIVTIPNGQISEVINYSKNSDVALINVTISYDSNVKKALQIIEKIANKYYEDNRDLFTDEKPTVLQGISEFKIYGATITCKFGTKTLQHWKVEREMRLLIFEAFQKAKIEIRA